MGKWFNYKSLLQYQKDIKVDRGSKLEVMLPFVIQIANTFPREEIAIGCLDINDLIQSGNVGLVEAWNKVDWDRIESSPNPQGELWSFLKTRIKFAIRQDINKYANEIRIPDRDIRKASKDMTAHEKIIVNIFPKFFDREVMSIETIVEPYKSIQLEDIIIEELIRMNVSVDSVDMLLMFYGVGYLGPMSLKDLSIKYMKKPGTIGQIISRTRSKLNNEEFKKKIINFYENM